MTAFQGFAQKGVPVVLVGDDIPKSGRLFCVQPGLQIIGRTIAELITQQIPPEGGILVSAGDVMVPSHYLTLQGFDAYLQENSCKNPVARCTSGDQRMTYEHLLHQPLPYGRIFAAAGRPLGVEPTPFYNQVAQLTRTSTCHPFVHLVPRAFACFPCR